FIIAKAKGEGYRIITGNYIKKEESEDLKSKLEKINSMNTEELRAYYLETLSTTELSQKGGAGLGMIDIARKSGHKIVYSFDGVTDTVNFFTLEVTIN
ncbi:MAG TPA: SiaB family protein kinase, partial [Bacteroidia bacterium]|nr:SiaB family protein kinase [Bacteroidia bacterium]